MELHLDIHAMAKNAFAAHELKREKGFTWRMQAPRTWNYGFRVTWAQGAVIVTGDLGEIVYRGMTFLWASPWDAALHLRKCHYDYLTSKTDAGKEYDRDATLGGQAFIDLNEHGRYFMGEEWSDLDATFEETQDGDDIEDDADVA